jgi:hypothetical protein
MVPTATDRSPWPPGFLGIEVGAFGIQKRSRRGAKQTRNNALAQDALLRIAAVRMKAVADDRLTVADNVGMNGDGGYRHLSEADERVADIGANRDNRIADFSDLHVLLPKADKTPPAHADAQPNDEVQNGN